MKIGDRLLWDQNNNMTIDSGITLPLLGGIIVDINESLLDTVYVVHWENGRKITYDQHTFTILNSNGSIKKDLQTTREDKINQIINKDEH